MSVLFSLWLLLTVPSLLAKSVGQVITEYKEEKLQAEKRTIVTRLPGDETDGPRSSSVSLSEWFLQIAHKNCLGSEGQSGTCMFNFECQQEHGEVVGACLDGFLFGACCHLPSNPSSESPSAQSTTHLVTNLTENVDVMETSMIDSLPFTSLTYLHDTQAGNGSKLMDQSSQPDMTSQPQHTLMFRNGSESEKEVNNQLASQFPVEALPFVYASSLAKKGEGHSESTLRVISSATGSESGLGNTVLGPWNVDVNPLLSAISDNHISALLTKTMSTTDESVFLDKEESVLQAQLNAKLPSSSVLQQELKPSTIANRVPIRNKGQSIKRPRPKQTTTSTTPNSISIPATPSDDESSTTRKTSSFQNTTDFTVTESTTSVVDQQASVLQFLASNSPTWVLEEIMNGTALTTWYPLPIPDHLPESEVFLKVPVETVPLSSPGDALPVTSRPTKKKPMKNRPHLSNRTISTTAPTANKTEDQSVVISLTTEAVAAVTVRPTDGTTSSSTTTRKPRPVYDYSKDCGVRPMVPEARIVGGRRSDYGRWPWQVLIRESTWFGIFSKNKCGGVLISDRHVLTAAHCQPGFLGSLLVVLGEFELVGQHEPFTPVEKNVKRVVVHRDYVERTFENDMAILELESPVEFKPYIVPICLPSISEGDFTGKKAEVTGWGKLSHNGPTPGVLYEVDVPIMSNPECHDMFKKAGHDKRILDSFVCAGYSEGKKDSCEGDSGGPLMVEGEDGRWMLVGTVSHGIRCAYPNMPGVYMRMTYYRPWIERVIGIGGIH